MATVTDKTFHSTNALIEYTGCELIVFTAPKWARLFFGILGETLASVKERYRINISNIENAILKETKYKMTFTLFLSDGRVYEMVFEISDELPHQLKADLLDKEAIK